MAETVQTSERSAASLVAEGLGQIVYLLLRSEGHRYLHIADLDWLVFPPLRAQQFRVYRDGDEAKAFVTWAHVSEPVHERLTAGHDRLSPNEWTGGPHPWVMVLAAPMGGGDGVLADLASTQFKGRAFCVLPQQPGAPILRIGADGKVMETAELTAWAERRDAGK